MKEIKNTFRRVTSKLVGDLRVCLRHRPILKKGYALQWEVWGGVSQLSDFKNEIYPVVGRVGSVTE